MDHLERCFCLTCGVEFWGPKIVFDECRRVGHKRSYYCPNGHGYYFRETTEERLTREKAALQRSCDFKESEITGWRNRNRALLGLVTKLKRKAGAK